MRSRMKGRRLEEILKAIELMPGATLLEQLVQFAALYIDEERGDVVDSSDAIVRALEARLAELGIAKKLHGDSCQFMLGDGRCRCSNSHWSFPRNGLPRPEL